jgi:hypothetical protein
MMDDQWHSQWIDEHQLLITQQHTPPPPLVSSEGLSEWAFTMPFEYGDVYTTEFEVGVFGGSAILRRHSCVVPVKTWRLGKPNAIGKTDRDIRLPGLPFHCTSRFLLCDTPRRAVRLLRKLTNDLPRGAHVYLDKYSAVDVGHGRKHVVNHQFIARPTELQFTPIAARHWKDELEDLREETSLHDLRVPNFTMGKDDWHRLWFADLARQVDKMITADDDCRRAEWRLRLRAQIDCELSHTW